jgi:membrane-associated phospholipid phosphatase
MLTLNTTQPTAKLSHKRLIITALLLLAGSAIFLFIYIKIRPDGNPTRTDISVFQWIIAQRTPELTALMQGITDLLSPTVIAVGVGVGSIIWAWRQKELWRPALLLGAMSVGFVVSSIIKGAVERHRPPLENMIPPFEMDYSFPSGHTIGVALLLLVLGYLVYSRQPNIRRFISWILVIGFGIGIIAISRIYLGYHWITDVTASVGLALVILGCVIIVDAYQPKKPLSPSLKK